MERIVKNIRLDIAPNKVALYLEDVRNVPRWNPLLDEVAIDEHHGRGKDASLRWRARVAGVELQGVSQVTAWIPGNEYAWRNTHQGSGSELHGSFQLKPADGGTDLTATVEYELPGPTAELLQVTGIKRHLEGAVQKALENIKREVAVAAEQR